MKANVSEVGSWSGGTVLDMAAIGRKALAATLAGIYLSADAGRTWRQVGGNLPDWFIQAVALAPMEKGLIALAASRNGWLYRSPDGGETWEVVDGWDPSYGVISRLLPSPNFAQDGVVFAGTEEDGVFKSRDRGRTWRHASFGLLNLSVTALACSPDFGRDEVAFAGTEWGGLFRSRNAGRAWRESGEGLPESAVQCIAVSPDIARDGVVLAGTEECGLYRSTDGGRTWSPVSGVSARVGVNDIYIAPDWSDGGPLFVATEDGILVSYDGGETWRGVDGGPEYPYNIVRTDDGWLASAYEDGVYASRDGATWRESNVGLTAHVPPLACFSPNFAQDRTLWLVSMEGVVVRSADAGKTWDEVMIDRVDEITSLAGVPVDDSLALVVLSGPMLLRSTDGGVSWQKVIEIEGLFANLSVTDGAVLAGSMDGRVWISRDGGASWMEAARFDGMAVTMAATEPLCAVTAAQTEDGTWRLSLRRMGEGKAIFNNEVGQPVAHLLPLDDGRLFCVLGGRMILLEGEKVVSESALEDETPVSSVAKVGDRLLVGARSGLFASDDGGRSWTCLAADLPAVALHPVSPTKVYAVTVGGRIWEVCL